MKMYGNRFEADDSLYKGGALADVVNGLSFDVENDPQTALRSALVAQGYKLNPQEVMKFTNPGYTYSSVDAGDRAVQSVFNPRNGKLINSKVAYGRNPTKVYEADANIRKAEIDASAQRYTADMGYAKEQIPRFSPVYGANGEVLSYNNSTGDVSDTGFKSYLRGPGGRGALSLNDKKNIDAMVANAIQLSTSKEDFSARLASIAGNNSEAQAYVQSVARNPQYMFKNKVGFYETAQNPYAQGGKFFPAAKLAEYAKVNNITEEAARKMLIDDGYVIN